MDDPAPVLLHAAGSLRAALTEIATAFETARGASVIGHYGPSGTLKDAIISGAKASIFASANMTHPQALARRGLGGPVVLFARNTLCALMRPGLEITTAALLDTMLDPKIRIGTSTPLLDPSGDYAFASFARAETIRPGAGAILTKKALQLTGAPDSATPPAGRNVYGWHIAEGHADLFITYRTNAVVATKENPGQQIVSLPETITIEADYGLTVMNSAPQAAYEFALFILSVEGQTTLAAHGFHAPGFSAPEFSKPGSSKLGFSTPEISKGNTT
jgi:ABC-type molybdate transport system substrate-binding protein